MNPVKVLLVGVLHVVYMPHSFGVIGLYQGPSTEGCQVLSRSSLYYAAL